MKRRNTPSSCSSSSNRQAGDSVRPEGTQKDETQPEHGVVRRGHGRPPNNRGCGRGRGRGRPPKSSKNSASSSTTKRAISGTSANNNTSRGKRRRKDADSSPTVTKTSTASPSPTKTYTNARKTKRKRTSEEKFSDGDDEFEPIEEEEALYQENDIDYDDETSTFGHYANAENFQEALQKLLDSPAYPSRLIAKTTFDLILESTYPKLQKRKPAIRGIVIGTSIGDTGKT